MKRIYGCDLWDGFCDVFNRAVSKPLGNVVDRSLNWLDGYSYYKEGENRISYVGKAIKATGIAAVWNVLSGNNLLKKHGLYKMDSDSVFGVRVLGAVSAMFATPLPVVAMGISPKGTEAELLILGMACLGFVTASLPRNAYVACKAQKEEDMKREAAIAGTQPPQV